MALGARGTSNTSRVIVGIWAFVILLPFYWLIITAFKSDTALISGVNPWPWIDFDPTLDAFRFLLDSGTSKVFTPFWNSTVAGLGSAFVALFLGSFAAYALARFDFGGNGKANSVIAFAFLATRMLPAALLLIPYLIMLREAGLLDTKLGLVLVYAAGGIPYTIWILREFYFGIPIALEEAARIDGASTWQVYRHIIWPLARPAHIAMFILLLVGAWNELLIALTVTFTDSVTLPIFLQLQNESLQGPSQNNLAAMTLLALVPMIIIAVALQRYIRTGLTTGALK